MDSDRKKRKKSKILKKVSWNSRVVGSSKKIRVRLKFKSSKTPKTRNWGWGETPSPRQGTCFSIYSFQSIHFNLFIWLLIWNENINKIQISNLLFEKYKCLKNTNFLIEIFNEKFKQKNRIENFKFLEFEPPKINSWIVKIGNIEFMS
jgi:hypothetical protein